MRAQLINSPWLLVCLAAATAFPAQAASRASGPESPPAAIVISGGTEAERRLLSGYLLGQLRGLTTNAHPLAITIVPDAEMRKLSSSGDSNSDTGVNPVSGVTRQMPPSTVTTPAPVPVSPQESSEPASASDDPDNEGEVDAMYDEADPSTSSNQPNSGRAEITLLKGEDTDDFTEAFLHEFGHHLWFTSMSQQDMSDFRTLYAESARAQSFVSDYAAVSVEEDFAEAFAYYEQKPKLLSKRDPEAAQFISQLLPRVRAADTDPAAVTVQYSQTDTQ